MVLDDILKKLRSGISGAYNAYQQGQTPAQYIAPKIINPVADAVRGTVSPLPDMSAMQRVRDVASSTIREFGNSIPQIGTSALRASPPGQLYEYSKILPQMDFKKLNAQSNLDKIQQYQNTLRNQQMGDAYNSLRGIGYLPIGSGPSIVKNIGAKALEMGGGGAINAGLGAIIDKIQGKNPLDNLSENFAKGATTVGPINLVNKGVGAIFPKLAPAATVNSLIMKKPNVGYGKVVDVAKTLMPSAQRIAGSAIRGGIEGGALGTIQPLEKDQSRINAIASNAALGAIFSGANQTGSEIKTQTLDRMRQALMLKHGIPPKEADNIIRSFIGDEIKRTLKQQYKADSSEPKAYETIRTSLGLDPKGDYIPSIGMTTRSIRAPGEVKPVTQPTIDTPPLAPVEPGKPLDSVFSKTADAENTIRDAIASGDLAGAKQLHADLSVDTTMKPFDALKAEVDQATTQMRSEGAGTMNEKYGDYAGIVQKMKSFLSMNAEKNSKKSGELFREHIPGKIFGVSSDEVATDLGQTESEFMQGMMDDIANKNYAGAKVKAQKILSSADKLKLDPNFYTVIKNLDDTIAVSAQATPKTMAQQRANVDAAKKKSMMDLDKEWRKAVNDRYKTVTPKMKETKQIKTLTGAIKENTTDGLPPIPDDMPTHKRNGWDSVKDFGKSLVLTSRKVLSDMGTYGKEASKRIDQYYGDFRKLAGNSVNEYQSSTRGMNDKSVENVLRFLDGQQVTLSSQEAKAASALRGQLDQYGGLAGKAQLMIETKDGRKVPFSMRDNYLPHMLDADKLKVNRENAISYFVKTGQMKSDIASQFVDDILKGGEVGDVYRKYFPNVLPKKYGNLETARLIDWSPEVLRYDKKLLPDYFEGAGKRITGAMIFGRNNEIADKLLSGIAKEGGNSALAEDIILRNLGIKRDPTYIRQASGSIRQFEGAIKLGLSAISNASQTVNTATSFGIRRTLRNIIPAIKDPIKRAFTEKTGTILDQTMKDMNDEVVGGGTLGKLIAPGFSFVERLNRVIAANTGKDFAVDTFNQLKNNPTSTKLIRDMEKMGINAGEALSHGSLTPDELVTAGQKGVDLTQFKVDPIDLPPSWASSGAKIFTQFKNFSFQQGKFIINEVGKEVAKGNMAPLARYLILGTVLGEGFADVKAAIRGKDRTTNPILRAGENIAQVGGGGVLTDALSAAQGGTEKIKNYILGPAITDAVSLVDNGIKAVQGKPIPLAKQLTNAIPIVGSPIANRVFPYNAATTPQDKITEKSGGVDSFLSDKADYSVMDQAAIDEQLKSIKKQRDDLIKNKGGILGIGKLSDTQIEQKVNELDSEKSQLDATAVFKKLTELNAMPTSSIYEVQKKKNESFKLIDDIKKLPPAMQGPTLEKMGISQDEAEYYALAKAPETEKYSYIQDRVKKAEDILPFLITVNGSKIATSGVVDKLYEDGIITKKEKAYINALKWDEVTQQFDTDRDYKASQAAAGAASSAKKLTALKGLLNTTTEAKVALSKPSQKQSPSAVSNFDSIFSRSSSTKGLDAISAMLNRDKEKIRHMKRK